MPSLIARGYGQNPGQPGQVRHREVGWCTDVRGQQRRFNANRSFFRRETYSRWLSIEAVCIHTTRGVTGARRPGQHKDYKLTRAARVARVVERAGHTRTLGDLIRLSGASTPWQRTAAAGVACELARKAQRVLRTLHNYREWATPGQDAPGQLGTTACADRHVKWRPMEDRDNI